VVEETNYGDGLAVITVTYSPGAALETFLDTLGKATTRTCQVILADNGSTDGAPQRAAERDGVRLVPTGGNLGYGRGANRGIAELGTDIGWVVVANPDVEWTPDSLDNMITSATRWPRAGSLGPLIREPDGSVYPSARSVPSLGRGFGHAVFGKVWPTNPWTRAYRQEDAAEGERAVGWLSGSCLLLRREAIDSVGGFDPKYFMYFEDVDLGERLAEAGWLNVYVPSAEVTHIGGHATKNASARMLRAHHDSAYRFLADRHRGLRWAPVRLLLWVGLEIRCRWVLRRSG
jgi:N-acetylglucosaminyl-diphospho-decaprenol L-rhamnosyltransferase